MEIDEEDGVVGTHGVASDIYDGVRSLNESVAERIYDQVILPILSYYTSGVKDPKYARMKHSAVMHQPVTLSASNWKGIVADKDWLVSAKYDGIRVWIITTSVSVSFAKSIGVDLDEAHPLQDGFVGVTFAMNRGGQLWILDKDVFSTVQARHVIPTWNNGFVLECELVQHVVEDRGACEMTCVVFDLWWFGRLPERTITYSTVLGRSRNIASLAPLLLWQHVYLEESTGLVSQRRVNIIPKKWHDVRQFFGDNSADDLKDEMDHAVDWVSGESDYFLGVDRPLLPTDGLVFCHDSLPTTRMFNNVIVQSRSDQMMRGTVFKYKTTQTIDLVLDDRQTIENGANRHFHYLFSDDLAQQKRQQEADAAVQQALVAMAPPQKLPAASYHGKYDRLDLLTLSRAQQTLANTQHLMVRTQKAVANNPALRALQPTPQPLPTLMQTMPVLANYSSASATSSPLAMIPLLLGEQKHALQRSDVIVRGSVEGGGQAGGAGVGKVYRPIDASHKHWYCVPDDFRVVATNNNRNISAFRSWLCEHTYNEDWAMGYRGLRARPVLTEDASLVVEFAMSVSLEDGDEEKHPNCKFYDLAPVRVRRDKKTPNSKQVAVATCDVLHGDLTSIDVLKSYFTE